jgi:hypothetical protein
MIAGGGCVRWIASLCVAAVFVLAATAPAPPVGAEEGETLDENARRARLMKTVAMKWAAERTKFPSRCPMCQGRGKTQLLRGGRVVLLDCTQCDGRRLWVAPKHYRIAYYDMRSPAFQALPGIKDRLETQYKAANSGNPWPTYYSRYRIQRAALVDATHGVVFIAWGNTRVGNETRWIWAVPTGKKQGDWWLYDEEADGPWPQGASRTDPVAPQWDTWETLDPEEHRRVREAVTAARITHRSFEYRKRGPALLVRLLPWADPKKRPPDERVVEDAVQLAKAVFPACPSFQDLHTHWYSAWRDAFGNVAPRPTWLSRIERAKFDQVAWSSLAPPEQAQQFDWERQTHTGWTPFPAADLDPGAADKEEPAPPPKPTAEEQPEPAPVAPPPPPPPVAAEEERPPRPLGEPSAGAIAKAEKGVARMREMLAQVKQTEADALSAQRAGAFDIFQEKLEEARALLAELEEVWLTDVAEHMPGEDEWDRDAVANERFGEIWDEVDPVKAAIRKFSAAK